MALEITFVGNEEIQFLSPVSLPNLRQALGENFLDSDSGYEDYTSDFDDGSENIVDKSCGEDAADMSDENFPVTWTNRFEGKNGFEVRKNSEGESGRESEKTPQKYISPEATSFPGSPLFLPRESTLVSAGHVAPKI